MIEKPFSFPKSSEFGRIISKNKIYEHGSPSTSVKQIFIAEVDQIRWVYKLAPNTINIPATSAVQEIQVISIALRGDSLCDEVLQTIDKSIPSPVLFELTTCKKLQYAACYKRRNESDKSRCVISSYFRSDWFEKNSEKCYLPVALSMESLYTILLKSLIPLECHNNETLQCLVERADLLTSKHREAEKLRIKRDREKQFNRRVELNNEIKTLEQEISALC